MKKKVPCMLLALLLAFSICPAQSDSLFPTLPIPVEVKVPSFGSMKMTNPYSTEVLLDGSIHEVYTSVTYQDYYDFGALLSDEGYQLDGQEAVDGGIKLSVSHGNARFTLTYYMYKSRLELFYPAGSLLRTIEETQYVKGEALLAAGQYAEAANAFAQSVGYRDGLKRAWNIRYQYLQEGAIGTNNGLTVGLMKDGTVVSTDPSVSRSIAGWTDIVAIALSGNVVIGLKRDGTVVSSGQDPVGQWTDIVAIAYGRDVTGLKSDGTVVTTGKNVDGWTGIIAIDSCSSATFGIKKDGRLVVTDYVKYDISGIDDAVAIRDYIVLKEDGSYERINSSVEPLDWSGMAVVLDGMIGLKKDGTVITGREYLADWDNEYGRLDVAGWTDIVNIYSDKENYYFTTVGLKSDGTVVAVGFNGYGACNVGAWRNIGHGDNLLQ